MWSVGTKWRALATAAVTVMTSLFAAVPVVGAGVPPTTAPPSDAERLAVYDEALVSLTQELSYLVLLGWVQTPLPPEARDMPGAIGIEPMATSEMIDAVRSLDEQRGPDALARLRAIGAPITPPIEVVLGRNVPIVAGEVPRIGAGVYLEAYDQLLGPWSTLSDAVDPTAASPITQATMSPITQATTPATQVTMSPITQVTTPVTQASTPATSPATSIGPAGTREVTESGGRSTTTPAIAAALLGAVLVVAATSLARRRQRPRRDRRPGRPAAAAASPAMSDDLLDAGRTIMAAADLDAFGDVVAAQIRRLTDADGALVADGRTWNPAGRVMPVATALERVIATGRAVQVDGSAIVPVVADGRVVGALIAWTGTSLHAEVLGAFAPLVGASLQGLRTRIEHEHLAFGDALTGVGNRRRFDRDLDRLVGPDSGRGTNVALAMVDVDHFKRFNDTHGHPAGDAALRHVASVIAANVREGDLVYRYGGEEFAILLPDTSLDEARSVVDRVRLAVASAPVDHGPVELPAVTVSVGLSGTPPVDAAAMMRTADGALYAAKSSGRNRVEVCPAP